MTKKTPENQYLAARTEWNDRQKAVVQAARMWQSIGLLGLLMAAASTGYTMYLSSQSQIIPYIVEVDRLGNAQGAGFARPAGYTEQKIIEAALADFVSNWRGVTVDGKLQKDRLERAYAFLSRNDPAVAKLNQYFKEDGGDPFERARQGTVSIAINSINRIPETESYQVDWTEANYDRKGILQDKTRFRVFLRTKIVPPADPKTLLTNPLGVYVIDLDMKTVLSS